MGLFGRKTETQPDWLTTLQSNQERLFVFLDKLETRMQELCEAAIPELQALNADSSDSYKQTYFKVRAGVLGQLNTIHTKATETYEEKIVATYRYYSDQISLSNGKYRNVDDFLNVCSNRLHVFTTKYDTWQQQLMATEQEDYEVKYQEIVADYNTIKNAFTCSQCGSGIFIDKIYFVTTYLKCPACSSQNVFDPGSKAKGLEHIARSLAEQRTRHLLARSKEEEERERSLYHEVHELSLSLHFEKDKVRKAQKEQRVKELNQQREEAKARAPQLYQQYARAMFDEWNKLVPELAAHNERFYESHYKNKL